MDITSGRFWKSIPILNLSQGGKLQSIHLNGYVLEVQPYTGDLAKLGFTVWCKYDGDIVLLHNTYFKILVRQEIKNEQLENK